MNWFSGDAPAGWSAVTSRAVNTAVVGFVVLQAKELYDAGTFDTPAAGVDALLIGVGIFILNAVIKWGKF